jgi:hypothetical protein
MDLKYTAPMHTLHFIDFSDYSKIILRKDNWRSCFKNIFKDEQITGSKIKELEPLRNSIAHGRELTKRQEDKLVMLTEELLECLGITL